MSRLLRFALVVSALVLTAVSASESLASDIPAATRDPAQAILTPTGKFIQELGDQAIKIVADRQMSATDRSAAFSKILSNCFDLKTIGRFVIGRTWNSATPAQQTEYMDLFKGLVIRNYGNRMTLYTGEGFKVVGTRPESDMDTTVLSHISHPDGSPPTQIDWRVRDKDGKLGVIDVVVEGVSLSVTQKQEYASIIHNNGGELEPLLKMMRDQLYEPKNTATAAAK